MRKDQSIPCLLIWLVSLAAVAIAASGGLYYFSARQTFSDLAATTAETVATLDHSYSLLEKTSTDVDNLHQLLRLEDPAAIEEAIHNLAEGHQRSAALIANCGNNAIPIREQFDGLVAAEAQVVDRFVKGQNAEANEAFFGRVAPQSGALLDEIRTYHQNILASTRRELDQRQQNLAQQLLWRSSALALILILVVFAGWRLKDHIARKLTSIAACLVEVSNHSLSGANQVSASSQSLAEGASQQAASLQETSASLEEMAAMTQRNAENAHRANVLAGEARAAAEKGAQDMQTMTQAMEAIKVSSDDIAKIIKTIDEIAFQTNILALNAAVEAARAGEAGMGFAVVADEVRSLAQRSATAAKETAAKIEGAIQNTGRGVHISRQVATSLNEIVVKAREVDGLASEVAAACGQQTLGISQLNVAIHQVETVTQASAANAEESAAAAEELNAQARLTKQIVGDLTHLVTGHTAEAPPAPPQESPSVTMNNGDGDGNHIIPMPKRPVAPLARELPDTSDFKDF